MKTHNFFKPVLPLSSSIIVGALWAGYARSMNVRRMLMVVLVTAAVCLVGAGSVVVGAAGNDTGLEINTTSEMNIYPMDVNVTFGKLTIHSKGPDGNPLDSLVYVCNQSTGSQVTYGYTGSDGIISFELAPDTYKIRVNKPSFIEYYPSIYLENVDVASGLETNRTATFNYGTLNVHSRDFDGNPLDSLVYVYNQSTSSLVTHGYTGSDGVISFELAPGTYKVWVNKPSFIESYPSIYLENVDVASGLETNRTATFNYGTLNVHSRDFDGNPLDSLVYVYNQSTGSQVTYGYTGSDGVISFELAPDTYKVMVRKSTDVWYYNIVVLGGEVTNIGDYINHNPVINSITASPARINPGGSTTITVSASDLDSDTLSYSYFASVGTVVGSGSIATYTAPETMDTYRINVVISDGNGGIDQGYIFVSDRYGNLVVNSRGVNGELLDSQVYVYKQSTCAYAGYGLTGSDGTITFSLLEDVYKIRVRESNDIWVENILVVYGSTGIIIGDDVNNTAPVINSYSPIQSQLNINEGQSFTFKINASDPDGFNPQYRWYLDGIFQSALPSWTYYASYTDSGNRIVTVEVTDGQYSVYQIWHVTVNNVNREDLVISNITWTPTNPSFNESVTFSIEVKNIGTAISRSSAVQYYIKGLFIDSDVVPLLAPGEASIQTYTWTADSCGNIAVSAIADVDDEIEEVQEGNNYLTKTLFINSPDLVITNISWEKQPIGGDIQAEDDVKISYKIKNIGDVDIEAFKSRILIEGVEFKTLSHSSLAANTEVAVEVGTWKAINGSHPIKVEADFQKNVDESDETNNDKSMTITVGPPPDLSIVGFEITQGIQNMESNGEDNSVPLIYGKPMVVRAFIESDSNTVNGVTGKLRLMQDGITKLELDQHEKLDVRPSGSWRRGNFDDSLNFIIYRGYLEAMGINSGDVEFEVEVNPAPHSIEEKTYENNKMNKTLILYDVPPFKLELIYLNHNPTGHIPNVYDFQRSLSYLERIYPISKIDYSYSVRDCSYNMTYSENWSKMLNDISSWWDKTNKVAMLHQDVPSVPGLNGQVNKIGGDALIFKPMNEYEYDFVGYNYRTLTMAHELGHELGFRHIIDQFYIDNPDSAYVENNINEQCGNAYDSTRGERYPYNNNHCDLSDDASNWGYYGFDIQIKNPIEPWMAGDLMTYRWGDEGRWISNYSYEKIFTKMSGITTTTFTLEKMVQMSNENKYLISSGSINNNLNLISLDPIYVIDYDYIYEPEIGNYSIELRDNLNNILQTHNFELKYPYSDLISDNSENIEKIGYFKEVLPYHPDTKTIVFKHNSIELTSVNISNNPPNVTVISPTCGESFSGIMNITWIASDIDYDELHYIVEYSPDNGSSWETLVINFNETNFSVNTDFLQGTKNGLIRVIASDGVNTGQDESDCTFEISSKAPEVVIISPSNETNLRVGSFITLSGSGYDLEDGMLNDSSLVWISDQNGVLGTGSDFWTRNLTRGLHTITLVGGDSDDNIATDRIVISVVDFATIDTPKGTVGITVTDGIITGFSRINESLLPVLLDVEFPFGVFKFNISELDNGETVNVSIEFSQELPPDSKYLKFGRTISDPIPHWYEIPMEISSNNRSIKIQLTDGGLGDDDLTSNGMIVDIGAPGISRIGDFSGDGTTDSWDITYLARSIAGIPGYESLSGGDVSGDGVVDVWDCTYLARAIAGIPEYNL